MLEQHDAMTIVNLDITPYITSMALSKMVEPSSKNEITTKDVIKLFSYLTTDRSLRIFVYHPFTDFLDNLIP